MLNNGPGKSADLTRVASSAEFGLNVTPCSKFVIFRQILKASGYSSAFLLVV